MTRKKNNILLDLDETLISSQPTDKTKTETKCKILKYNYNMDDIYIVFERPNLQDFLEYIFENYNVSVWTAASKSYALSIIENIILIDKRRKLDWIFYSYHCDLSNKLYNSSKNLKILWNEFKKINNDFGYDYNEENTVIIDDNKEVYDSQPDLCIRIKEFLALKDGSEKDNVLIETVKKQLEEKFK